MAEGALLPVNLRTGHQVRFAYLDRRALGHLRMNARIQWNPNDLLLERERRVSHRDWQMAKVNIEEGRNGNHQYANQKSENHISHQPKPLEVTCNQYERPEREIEVTNPTFSPNQTQRD
jgi:hypothetical protein